MVHAQRTYNRCLVVVRPDLSLTSFCRAELFCVAGARLRDAVVASLPCHCCKKKKKKKNKKKEALLG